MSVEARQLVHLYLSIHQEAFDSEMCWSAILHEVLFSMNDHWHVGQEIRHAL
jgi:hypothetical protein